jgi:hypothetical protein
VRLYAQDTSDYIAHSVHLDEVVISAIRGGFNVNNFIKRVEDDTTFYKAFKTLRIIGYTSSNDIKILNKKGKVEASLKSITRQVRNGNCRSMQTLAETTTGSFYRNKKKKKYNYYTAELYSSLFLSKDTVCGEDNIVNGGKPDKLYGSADMQRHEDQLRQLIFNPGQPVSGVPLVGQKVAIFNNNIAPMYDFSITSELKDGVPCYVFTATAKPAYKNDVVINYLVTYFNKSNFAIIARKYSLSYNTILFDFDVQMDVELTTFDGQLIPSYISYHGNWDIPFHKRERADFTTSFYDFNNGE